MGIMALGGIGDLFDRQAWPCKGQCMGAWWWCMGGLVSDVVMMWWGVINAVLYVKYMLLLLVTSH